MSLIKLIYYPLVKGEFNGNEKLNLKGLSDSLKKFSEGIDLLEKDFPSVEIMHSFGSANYMGGGPALDLERVLQYLVKFSGEENSLKNAVSSYIDFCGIPHAVGGKSNILKEYFGKKRKRLYGGPFYFLEPHKRKLVGDEK